MADSDIHRELGSLVAQVETLNREMKELKADVKEIRDDFNAMKGGSRVMMGIAALLGGGLTWGLNYVFGKH